MHFLNLTHSFLQAFFLAIFTAHRPALLISDINEGGFRPETMQALNHDPQALVICLLQANRINETRRHG